MADRITDSAVHTVLSARLRTWQEPDGFLHLWEDWQQDARQVLGAFHPALAQYTSPFFKVSLINTFLFISKEKRKVCIPIQKYFH